MAPGKLSELIEEFRAVVAGRSSLVDSIVPPVLFLVIYALVGFRVATWSALVVAGLIALWRLRQGQSLLYALGGVAGVALAVLISQVLGRAEGFFLPGLLTGALTVVVAVVSIIAGKPMVAWTSYVARRWPLDWYWHPQVRPAYTEVTWLWALFFALRLLLQYVLFRNAETGLLALTQVLTGWPAIIVLLIVSYLYGTWRLRNLGGPSVEEFKEGAAPPWQGQQRGF